MVVPLGPVQETMLITLHARAVNGDADARRLVEAVDYDFGPFEKYKGLVALFHVLRSAAYDEWTRQFFAECPQGTVVELGAGLSTRAERLDNGQARWCFVDLPDAVALRNELLPDGDRRVTVAADVRDPSWAGAVAGLPGPYLFLAEGLLVYLDPADVHAVLRGLGQRFPGCRIALDTYGEWIIREPRGPLAGMAARMVWACPEPKELEDLGLTLRTSWPLTRPESAVRDGLSRRTRATLTFVNAVVPSRVTEMRVNLFSAG